MNENLSLQSSAKEVIHTKIIPPGSGKIYLFIVGSYMIYCTKIHKTKLIDYV